MTVGLASAVQNFDANGYWIRLLSGTGNNSLSVGQLPVGGSAPAIAGIQGARPQWVGDLKPSDFRPDVPCSSQPVPSLGATTAAPDLRRIAAANAPTTTITNGIARLLGLR
jgi:hypothetical protein